MIHFSYDSHEFVYLETSSKLNDAKSLPLHLSLSILSSQRFYGRQAACPDPVFYDCWCSKTYSLVFLLYFFFRLLYQTSKKTIISLHSRLCQEKHTTLSARAPRPMSTR